MGILSNFIAGAAGAGGDILQRNRESAGRQEEYQNNARFADDLAGRRAETVRQAQEEMGIRAEGRAVDARRAEEAYQATPERVDQQVGAKNRMEKGILAGAAERAPGEAALAKTKFDLGKDVRAATAAEGLQVWKDQFAVKTEAELSADIKRMNDPKYLQGKAREAAAGRDPNSAALHKVQLEAAQMALKEKQEEAKIPAAVKDEIAGLRELIKGKSAIIDKAKVEGTATPDGLKEMEAEKSAMAARVSQLRNNYLPESLRTPDKAKSAPNAPPDGTRGKVDGVMGTVINGQFVPDGAKPAKPMKPTSRTLPRSFDDIPGVEDVTPRVSSGAALMSPERTKLFAQR